MALLSRRFRLSLNRHWPGPGSLAATSGVSVDVLSYGYLDVSVPRVRHFTPILFRVSYLLSILGNHSSKSARSQRDRRLTLNPFGISRRPAALIFQVP